jgi:hypothetical protein
MPLWADCLRIALEESTASFFDATSGTIDYDNLRNAGPVNPIPLPPSAQIGNAVWPQFPLGQLLFGLLSAPPTEPLLKAWMPGVLNNVLRNRPDCFTVCPEHPRDMLVVPRPGEYLRCPAEGCMLSYCGSCFAWHAAEDLEACRRNEWHGPRCPGCGVPSVKQEGCNHVQCLRCGTHWCYCCDYQADTSDLVYRHMEEKGHINAARPE